MSLTTTEQTLFICGIIGLSIFTLLLSLNVFGLEFTQFFAKMWVNMPYFP